MYFEQVSVPDCFGQFSRGVMGTCLTFVCCTEAGALASWGGAEFGQLGFEGGGLVDGVQPRIIKGSRELHFARVAAGAAHTLALTGAVPLPPVFGMQFWIAWVY